MPDPYLITILVVTSIALLVFGLPRYRLHKALAQPFPNDWKAILRKRVSIYQRMPTDLQAQLEQRVKQFIHEKHFTGCNGLEMTDEMRVTIAGSACLLLLNRETAVYPGLRYILVYPEAFLVERVTQDDAGLMGSQRRGLLGESWDNGKVILSWADVLQGNRHFNDGQNVALHEFAHQLDHEDGSTNGAPPLSSAARYQRWAHVFTREFEVLQQAAYQHDETLIDYYGATNPAEFFAVVTETFFEQPNELAERHPSLFSELQHYYQVNPADWHSPPEAESEAKSKPEPTPSL